MKGEDIREELTKYQKTNMIRITSLLFAILLQLTVFTQEKNADKALEYAKSITALELKEHLEIIASDEYQGRETGKEGQKMAMEYLISNFKNLKIEEIAEYDYVQSFPLIEQYNDNIQLSINRKELNLFEDFYIFNNYIKDTSFSTELHFLGFGNKKEDYESLSAKSIILIGKDTSENALSIEERVEIAKDNGLSAVVIVLEDFTDKLIMYNHSLRAKRMFLADDELNSAIPVIYISTATAEKILPKFSYSEFLEENKYKKAKSKKKLRISIDKPTEKFVGENVLAYIPGTDLKDELVVITAHYDHLGIIDSNIYNGADDNGTGTVALLEIAEAFMKAKMEGNAARRSILIMPVSGEEKGLLGSQYYSNNPVFPLEKTIANLNVDMIGRIDEKHQGKANYVYLIGADRLSQDLHDISKNVATKNFDIELDYTFNELDDPNRFYYRSDHYNFAKHNIPSIFYFSGVHEDYHKATDTEDKILYDKVELISRLIFMTAWELANRENSPQLNKSNTQ